MCCLQSFLSTVLFPEIVQTNYGYKESWVPKNWCFWTVVLEKTLESPLDCKEIQPVHPIGDQSWVFFGRCWSWNSNTLATWCKELTYLKRPWCWERLKAGREGDDRGWDGWMASPTQWVWVWVDSGSWWWTGGLVCCGSWGCKELDTTEQLNWTGDSCQCRWEVWGQKEKEETGPTILSG